jgi:hypothetical protein
MKKKVMALLSLIVLLMLVLALNVQPVLATGEKILLTKTALTVVPNGENYDITYQFTVKNDGNTMFSKSLTDIYIDDEIHGISVGTNVVNWGTLVLAPQATADLKTWTYTTKPSDIDTDGLGNRSVTNIARVHSVTIVGSTKGTLDIWDDATCCVPLGGVDPLPELPAGVLFGVGLAGIGGFILIKKRKAAAAK